MLWHNLCHESCVEYKSSLGKFIWYTVEFVWIFGIFVHSWISGSALLKNNCTKCSLGKLWKTGQCVGKQVAKVNVAAFFFWLFLILTASLLTTAEAVWEMSSICNGWCWADLWFLIWTHRRDSHTHTHNYYFHCIHQFQATKNWELSSLKKKKKPLVHTCYLEN